MIVGEARPPLSIASMGGARFGQRRAAKSKAQIELIKYPNVFIAIGNSVIKDVKRFNETNTGPLSASGLLAHQKGIWFHILNYMDGLQCAFV